MDSTEVALTEFSDLDPDELHLVKRAASGFPALLAKSVAAEIEAAKKPPLPDYVQKQIDDAHRRRRLAHSRAATREDISNIQETPTSPKQSKTVKAAASSIRRSLAKSVAAGRSVLR